jgi:hypothetical protein
MQRVILTPSSAGAQLATRNNNIIRRVAVLPARRISTVTVAAQKPYKTPDGSKAQASPAFTRRREHAVGRVAMVSNHSDIASPFYLCCLLRVITYQSVPLRTIISIFVQLGVAAAWAGEVLTGLGPISQLASELGVTVPTAYGVTALLVALQLVLGVNQFSATWSDANQQDVNRRTKGLTGITAIEPDTSERIKPTQEPGKFLLRNEIVLGRLAMLIFAGAAIAEFTFGGESPLAHVGLIPTGVPLMMAPWWLKTGIVLFTAGGLGAFSGFSLNKDPDTY